MYNESIKQDLELVNYIYLQIYITPKIKGRKKNIDMLEAIINILEDKYYSLNNSSLDYVDSLDIKEILKTLSQWKLLHQNIITIFHNKDLFSNQIEKKFNKINSISKTFVPHHQLKALYLNLLNNHAKALEECNQSLSLLNNGSDLLKTVTYQIKAKILLDQYFTEYEAISYLDIIDLCDKAIKLFPMHYCAYNIKKSIYFKVHKTDLAIAFGNIAKIFETEKDKNTIILKLSDHIKSASNINEQNEYLRCLFTLFPEKEILNKDVLNFILAGKLSVYNTENSRLKLLPCEIIGHIVGFLLNDNKYNDLQIYDYIIQNQFTEDRNYNKFTEMIKNEKQETSKRNNCIII